MTELALNRNQYLELEKLALGVFEPVREFMNENEFHSVVSHMRLSTGQPFPLPIVLDITASDAVRLKGRPKVSLSYQGIEVGHLSPDSIFTCDKAAVAQKIFGTASPSHPGADFFFRGGDFFVGGQVSLTNRVKLDLTASELTPDETRREFARRQWKTIVGFQTRNVPHRAHEYLHRLALDFADGLFVQPLIGRKKIGDYTPEAVVASYKALIEQFFPVERVLLGALTTNMRYAGPREAVFHAIVRRNYGCTHFIVGRDHAGVGNFYGRYDAQKLAVQFQDELGITILPFAGPYYCAKCDGIVTERNCSHGKIDPAAVREISGTYIRSILVEGKKPDQRLFRPEILRSLDGIKLFIDEEE